MANPKQVRIQTKDQTLNRMQDATKSAGSAESSISKNSIISANVTAAFQEIPHTLGRKAVGAMLVKGDGTAAVIYVAESEIDGEKFIRIQGSGAINGASILVF